MENFDNINLNNISDAFYNFHNAKPFDYCVIDNFFKDSIADQLSEEIPSFESPFWHEYNNAIEIKKTCNDWNKFPKLTYNTFSFLNSNTFIKYLEGLSKNFPLFADHGLNGGGWHIHSNGGKLNPHLDYSIHPKLGLQRKLNIIIYLEKDWKNEWGGHLGLYSDTESDKSKKLEIEIEPKFNRCIIFDTTQNSWHGLSQVVNTPPNYCRKSMAVYYLTLPPKNVNERCKALFAPTKDQDGDKEVIDLIHKRSNINFSSSVYKNI
jgi:hypothetical protein